VTLDEIATALAAHTPRRADLGQRRGAAVAMVLRELHSGPEVLFIERARHPGDPWSGHMAFPGGRMDPTDPDPRTAAERETQEEVGLDLRGARCLGRLDDMEGHNAAASQLVISGYVYRVEDPPELAPNREVAMAFWFPLAELHEPRRQTLYPLGRAGMRDFPGILVGEAERHIVWGLTHRFLEVFFQIVGRPLPQRYPADLRQQLEDLERSGSGSGDRVLGPS
jgi:8-oxo-dGTP pyrophosphatase MutT (NUDIX family)